MLRDKDIYTVVTFLDGREMLVKGYTKAMLYALDHESEIESTYTDHTGRDHLEKDYNGEVIA